MASLLDRIESTLATVYEDLAAGRGMSLPIRPRGEPIVLNSDANQSQSRRKSVTAFPGRNLAEGKRFERSGVAVIVSISSFVLPLLLVFIIPALFNPRREISDNIYSAIQLAILNHIHRCLIDGVVMTKRDIYYQDPALFRSQRAVDRTVDDIAFAYGVGRSALNVTASPRGLVYGCFEISTADGSVVEGTSDSQGQLVPRVDEDERIDMSNVYWVLIVEKEATFRSLIESGVATNGRRPGMLVTAKGYPDLATRLFLAFIARSDLCLPMYVLTDYDPDGLAIAAIYAAGSRNLAHEGEKVLLPRLHWAGVKSEDVASMLDEGAVQVQNAANVADTEEHQIEHAVHPQSKEVKTTPPTPSLNGPSYSDEQGLLRLTGYNRQRARGLLARSLERHEMSSGGWTDWEAWRRELQVMLMLNIKAEMQILEQDVGNGGLRGWVEAKLGL